MPIVERDERGRAIRSTLTSEQAQTMQANRTTAIQKRPLLEAELLQEAGFPDAESAPASLRALVSQIAKGGAASVSAVSLFLKQVRGSASGESGGLVPPGAGEPCPLCHRPDWTHNRIDSLLLLADVLVQERKRRGIDSASAVVPGGVSIGADQGGAG